MNNPENHQTTKPSLPSVLDLFNQTISFYRSRFNLFFKILAILFFLWLVSIFIGLVGVMKAFSPGMIQDPNFYYIFLTIILLLVFVPFHLLSLYATLAVIVEEGHTLKSAYQKGLKLFFPLFWTTVIFSFTVLGGVFLFLIPGLILGVYLSLFPYVVLSEERRGISALARSWYYVKGYWWSVFWRYLFFAFCLSSLSSVVLVIMSLVIKPRLADLIENLDLPLLVFEGFLGFIVNMINFFIMTIGTQLMFIYAYKIYLSLKNIKESALIPEDEEKSKIKIRIFAIIGFVIFAFILFAPLFLGLFGGLIF